MKDIALPNSDLDNVLYLTSLKNRLDHVYDLPSLKNMYIILTFKCKIFITKCQIICSVCPGFVFSDEIHIVTASKSLCAAVCTVIVAFFMP